MNNEQSQFRGKIINENRAKKEVHTSGSWEGWNFNTSKPIKRVHSAVQFSPHYFPPNRDENGVYEMPE